jgi:uncharacterized protein YecE (DUF72 family)
VKPCVYVGTSGWFYKHWHSHFYPEGLSKSNLLSHYACFFPSVEINASFYRLPTEKMVKSWHDKVPEEFIYAVKGSRLITHFKKLKNVEAPLDIFLKQIAPLNEHLGPILWQLPPQLVKDLPRLAAFLSLLPKTFQHAVEFRHPSWIDQEVFKILKKHKTANVWLSSQRMPMNFTVTSSFIYLRFHGLEGGAAHDYKEEELKPWAEAICKEAQKNHTIFAYFNNDWNERAPENARKLIQMVGDYAFQPAGHLESSLDQDQYQRRLFFR